MLPITADRAAYVCGDVGDANEDDDAESGLPIEVNMLFGAAGEANAAAGLVSVVNVVDVVEVATTGGIDPRRFHIHCTTRTVFNPLPLYIGKRVVVHHSDSNSNNRHACVN
jgi:hypothetical protein